MMHTKKEFMRLSADFKECRDVLVALGDENRLHILYQMMITAEPMGIRVGDIVRMKPWIWMMKYRSRKVRIRDRT